MGLVQRMGSGKNPRNIPMVNIWKDLARVYKPFLVLAPLDGVTDFVFREIIAGIAKPDVFFTEFTNVDALLSKGFEKTIPRFRYSQSQRFIVAQIWGTAPKNFYKVAQLVKNLGFDGIDINMGCPDRAVMRVGSGASLINNPLLAAEIIAATKEGAPGLPVSVKTRIGVNMIVTESWIEFLLNQHIDALIVHGRTVKELSKVPAHWDEIGRAVTLRDDISPGTIIIGNGDVLNRKQAEDACTSYGADGVMIGKGVFHNPWVFERIPKNHTRRESLELLLKHTKLFCDTYPDTKRFPAMKKYYKIYVRSYSGAVSLMKELMNTKNYSEVEKLVKPYI